MVEQVGVLKMPKPSKQAGASWLYSASTEEKIIYNNILSKLYVAHIDDESLANLGQQCSNSMRLLSQKARHCVMKIDTPETRAAVLWNACIAANPDVSRDYTCTLEQLANCVHVKRSQLAKLSQHLEHYIEPRWFSEFRKEHHSAGTKRSRNDSIAPPKEDVFSVVSSLAIKLSSTNVFGNINAKEWTKQTRHLFTSLEKHYKTFPKFQSRQSAILYELTTNKHYYVLACMCHIVLGRSNHGKKPSANAITKQRQLGEDIQEALLQEAKAMDRLGSNLKKTSLNSIFKKTQEIILEIHRSKNLQGTATSKSLENKKNKKAKMDAQHPTEETSYESEHLLKDAKPRDSTDLSLLTSCAVKNILGLGNTQDEEEEEDLPKEDIVEYNILEERWGHGGTNDNSLDSWRRNVLAKVLGDELTSDSYFERLDKAADQILLVSLK